MPRNGALGFAEDVVAGARDIAPASVLWVPTFALSLSTDLLMQALEWPFRGGPMPPERTITTMAIVIFFKAWFGLTLCHIALALLRRQRAGFLNNWVSIQTGIRICIVNVVLLAPMLLGAMFFALPGLYLLARWSQAVMLQIDGEARWFEAPGQSAMLTEGYKLPILAVWAAPLVAGAMIEWFAGHTGIDGPGAIGFLLASAGRAIASLAGVALAAATYHELVRRAPWQPDGERAV